jgi:transcriptional regulator with XRE-family HTH domain
MLTSFDVKAIIKQYNDGATCSFIAEQRGMSPSAVSRILKTAGIEIRTGRPVGSNRDTEFLGKTRGKAGRRCAELPKLRNARIAANIPQAEIAEFLGRYPAWVSLIENGTMRPTPERLEAIGDAIEALDMSNAPTVRAAAEERARRFRDPDANTKPYKKRGTGRKAQLKRQKVAAAKQHEAEVVEIMKLSVRPETKAKILLALFGVETAEQLAA